MENKKITIKEVKNDSDVIAFIARADKVMEEIGYTEHGYRHADLVSKIAFNILDRLGYSQREAELAEIAGYLHDIGNLVNRKNHYLVGAKISGDILKRLGMEPDEVSQIMSAIGNHEEESGTAIDAITAALILADKSDVHRSRVRRDIAEFAFDIHDRVNYAVNHSFIRVNNEEKKIELELEIDTDISQVMDYFEIFLDRMTMCRRAADTLECEFEIIINGMKIL
ncbi:MAG: HD domain-containing protein [Actinomycetia bacterium]|nr:HD domain-containing protein [Actinomycetes bacterium]